MGTKLPWGEHMKKLIIILSGFIVLFLTILPPANSNPLDGVPAWYCTISGNAGGFKISFQTDGILTGVGATATGGVVSLTGTYTLDTSTNKFSGSCHFSGAYLTGDGSFSGKVSKTISFQMLLNNNTYKVTGASSVPNTAVRGFFDCTVKGIDKGSFVLEAADSDLADTFFLVGMGTTTQLGKASMEMLGYADSKGNLYGQWYAQGERGEAEGTFKGKYQGGKLSINGKDAYGNSFTLQSGTKDMTLNVPYEPNYGSTCLSSSMTMVLKFWGTQITFDQVFGIFGLPGFPPSKWQQFESWIDTLGMKMITYDKGSIEEVIRCVYYGYPVVALQSHDPADMQGHDRVIVGYNLSQEVFILNDPSNFGPRYKMGFDEFESLWNYNGYGSPGLFYLIMPKTSQNPLSDRSPYIWY
jgi:hypothetical protein